MLSFDFLRFSRLPMLGLALWTATMCPDTGRARELVVIDGTLPEVEILATQSNRETVVLPAGVHPLASIGEALRGEEPVNVLHIISHGAPGRIRFAGREWDAAALSHDEELLAAWRDRLANGAEILLYGCDVAQTAEGRDFLAGLARATGASVAASTGPTGPASRGADWALEYATKPVHGTPLAFPAYSHVLATLSQGDLVVTGWNAFTDTVTFVALADIPSGTVIKITDRGWDNSSGAFTTLMTGDGIVTWTVPTGGVAAGSVLRLVLGGSDNSPANSLTNLTNSANLTSSIAVSTYTVTDPLLISGDQIFFYQDSDTSPFFISGFNNSGGTLDGSGWNTSVATTLRDSTLPNGTNSQNSLVNGTNAMGVTPAQLDNVQYTGPVTAASRATWLSRLTNISNWTGDNTTPGSTTSTITTGVSFPPPAPVISSMLTASGTYGSAISTYTITASNSPSSYSASGLPSGLSVNTSNGQITGTPTTSGTFNVTIGATNAGGTGSATLVFTIGKKNLTVSGVTASNKTYDAGLAATLGFGSASLIGVVGGDTITLNTGSASGAFVDKNVGTGKTVTISGLSLSGASSGNYLLTQPTTTANITTAGLTVTGVTASGKAYDGGTGVTLNVASAALSGVILGDSVTLGTGSAVGTFSDKNVGVGKTVTVSGLTIGGTDSGNYSLTQPTATATITAAGLSVTGVTASNKTYDGGTGATLNLGSASLAGVIGGDSVTLSTGSASGNFTTKTVGTGKTVTVSGLALGGTDSGNYSLTQPSTTANITAATLTVSGVTANNKTYDGGTSATLNLGSAGLVGVVGGDSVTLNTASANGNFATKTVGTGKTVTVSGLALGDTDADNYALTQPTTTADITTAGLTVTGVTAENKTYDGGTSATLNLGSAALSGVVGGDDVTLVTGSAVGAFADANVDPGKTVTVSGLTLSGTDSGNYSLTQPTTSASITAATLTVTADDKTRAYGFANPMLTASITGFVNSETSAVLSGAPALSTSANAASTPGAYSITAAIGTLSAGNYTFAFADGTLTVRLQEIADWEEENFTLEELGNPLVSGPDADPDLDGVTNLYEYAFGTDPNDIASGPDPLVYTGTFAGGGTLVETGKPITRTETAPINNTRVLFIRRKPSLTSDLEYAPQFSNGTTWVTSTATPQVLAESDLYQVVSVPYVTVVNGKKTRTYRVVPAAIELP